MAKDFDAELARWLVKRRSEIQELVLEIHTFSCQNPKTVKDNWAQFSLFLGTGFSLWRAVFYSDHEFEKNVTIDHAQDFFTTVIDENAIGFSQENRNRSWTVGYYLNNSVYRMYRLANVLNLGEYENKSQIETFWRDGIIRSNPKYVCETVLVALRSAFENWRKGK
jgi:hypothetical protein